jgi:hypothetical protein
MYGPDAERLFRTIEPIIRRSALAAGGFAIQDFGEDGEATVRDRW